MVSINGPREDEGCIVVSLIIGGWGSWGGLGVSTSNPNEGIHSRNRMICGHVVPAEHTSTDK